MIGRPTFGDWARVTIRCPRGASTVVMGSLLLGCCASTAWQTRTTSKPADAEGLQITDVFRVQPDGKVLHHAERTTQIHTEYAVDALGDPRIQFDSGREKLHVLRAETTMRDGTRRAIQPNSLNQATPAPLAGAPAYADRQEMVVTHVGMETGCTIDLAYDINGQTPESPWSATVPLQSWFPTRKRSVEIVVPAEKSLHWACVQCEVKPTVQTRGPEKHFAFRWQDLPGLDPGPDGMHGSTGALGQPRLIFSTAASWSAVSGDFSRAFDAVAVVDSSVEQRVQDLVENDVTADQRMTTLWRFVAEDLKTIDWPLAEISYQMSPAAAVLTRSYGHGLDKAVLLSAMLKAAGIENRPVLLSRDAHLAMDVPTLGQFSDIWLVAKIDQRDRWLSPTAVFPGAGPSYLTGRHVLDVAVGSPIAIAVSDSETERNQSSLSGTLRVQGDGTVRADLRVVLTGTYSPYFALQSQKDEPTALTNLLQDMSPQTTWQTDCEDCYARLVDLSPEMVTISFHARVNPDQPGRYFDLEVPWPARSQAHGADIHRSVEPTDTALQSCGSEITNLTIELPEGWAIGSTLPTDFVSNSVGELLANQERNPGQLVLRRTLRIRRRMHGPDDYRSWRELVSALHRSDHRTLLVEQTTE